jgi:nucleoside-diphosphate-sugar epimerase
MAILITGAMGHVGYATVRAAARAGLRVVAQYRESFREKDAAALGPDVVWVKADLTDAAAVKRLAEQYPVDACIHLAAMSSEAYARPQPLAAFEANVSAAAHLLDAARTGNWRRFIQVSTGSVFQSTDAATPILEDTHPSPRNIYGTTKRCAELLALMYRSQYGLPVAVVRISWVYGPPVVTESPIRGPIPPLLIGALRGQARRDAGGGDFAASFTYIEDVAAGLLAACAASRLNHGIYHLGSGTNYAAHEVAACVRAAVPGAVIEMGPGTEPWTAYATMRGPLAGDRLSQDTGFSVRHSLAQGVAAYADWLRRHPETWR